MGAEDLSETVTPKRSVLASLTIRVLLFLPCIAEGRLCAQNPMDTGYQKSFFARREAWVDGLFAQAPAARKRAALVSLQRALDPQFRNREVSATQRLEALAKTAAILSGLALVLEPSVEPEFANEKAWKSFLFRFNLWLLALPAVIDPDRTKQDLLSVKKHHRSLHPRLRHGPVRQQDIEGGHLVHLTARAVLSYPKPHKLELRLGIANLAGSMLQWSKRGDSDNPHGWRAFELVLPFSARGLSGSYVGEAFVAFDGSWPGAKAPRAHARFEVRRGFFRDLWRFIAMRQTLSDARDGNTARTRDMATLDVDAAELMRVFLYGDTYVFRSWPLRALDDGLELARSMLDGEISVLPRRGDRVFGIPVKGGRSLPVRVLWQEASSKHGSRKAWIHFAPSTWSQDYAIDGLRLTSQQLLRKPNSIHVFLAMEGAEGYIGGVQELLKDLFAIEAANCSIVGILDGCTRARFALPLFSGQLDQVVLIAGIVPDAALLASEKFRSIRVIPAYGLPTQADLNRCKKLQVAGSMPKQVVFDSHELRSLSQALMRL